MMAITESVCVRACVKVWHEQVTFEAMTGVGMTH